MQQKMKLYLNKFREIVRTNRVTTPVIAVVIVLAGVSVSDIEGTVEQVTQILTLLGGLGLAQHNKKYAVPVRKMVEEDNRYEPMPHGYMYDKRAV